MKKTNQIRMDAGLLLILAMGLMGCSSLPKHPVEDSDFNHRTTSYHNLGHKNYLAGQYEKAGAYFEQALSIHAALDDRPGVVQSLTSLGRSLMAQGEIDSAEAHFQQALSATWGLQRPDLEAQALGGLGAVELYRQNPQEAKTLLEAALERPLADPGVERAILLHDLGSAHRKLGKTKAAESHFRQALAMHESLADALGVAADCYSLALLMEAEGDHEQSLQLARRALANDKRAGNPPGVAQDLTLLGSLAYGSGAHQQGSDYSRRAKLAWQALGQVDKAENISVQMEKMQTVGR